MKKAGMVTMESSQNENMLRKVIESLQKTV